MSWNQTLPGAPIREEAGTALNRVIVAAAESDPSPRNNRDVETTEVVP